ncbi:PLD nuclease N-terminal domain-containing protein [Brevibacterium metallidurans]|uniref:Cardiolipin synthase N-terminal domain-containing protein n=1 Tax=Brevibacterium metallidurans TaxID=1482676 RepID=A0ABN0SR92_9MICO
MMPGTVELVLVGIIVVGFALFVWALVSILQSRLESAAKLAWAFLVFLFPVAGPIVWLVYRAATSPPR